MAVSFWSATGSAISATACWCWPGRRSPGSHLLGRSHPPTTSDEEREALVGTARQPAVPARADHSRSPRSSARLLYNYTPLRALGLDRAQARDLRLPRLSACCIALAVSYALAAAARAGAGAGGPPADRRDRLGGGAAADARGARRGVRRGRRRHDHRRDRRCDHPARQHLPRRRRSTRSAWRCSR